MGGFLGPRRCEICPRPAGNIVLGRARCGLHRGRLHSDVRQLRRDLGWPSGRQWKRMKWRMRAEERAR